MKTIEEQARAFAKRWCEENGKNSRHLRIKFAVAFAADRELLIAELRARVRELEEVAWNCGPFCDSKSDGYTCTRIPGHTGNHVAHGCDWQELKSW